jgi:hypothetical protein
MGIIREVPPVYDPGGPVCLIDDYTVAHPDLWGTVGVALYQEAKTRARQRGAVAMVTLSAFQDGPKRTMLQAQEAALTVENSVQPF